MARYDLYARPGDQGFLLDVQADVLGALSTRVVVPLLPAAQAPLPAKRLNPVFDIEGLPHVLVTQFMAAVQIAGLGHPVGSLASADEQIMAALDMVFVGF